MLKNRKSVVIGMGMIALTLLASGCDEGHLNEKVGREELRVNNESYDIQENKDDEKYKWDVDEAFKSSGEFEEEMQSLEKQLDEVSKFEETVENVDDLVQILQIQKAIFYELDNLANYSVAKMQESVLDTEMTSRLGKVEKLLGDYVNAFKFVDKSVADFSKDELDKALNDERLKEYRSYYINFLDDKENDLAKVVNRKNDKEKMDYQDIINQNKNMSWISENIHESLFYIDLFPIEHLDENGKKSTLYKSDYERLISSEDEKTRDLAWKSKQRALQKLSSIFVLNIENQIRSEFLEAQLLGYETIREKFVKTEEIPQNVIDDLIENANKYIELHHRYYEIKSKIMGREKIKSWKRSDNIFEEENKEYAYEEAAKMIKRALKPLGEDVVDVIDKAINERWIDVYPNEKKNKTNRVIKGVSRHPLINFNFYGNYGSVRELAKHLGTASSEYFMSKEQNIYQIYLANATKDIPGDVNAFLLNRYMIENAQNDKDKMFYINEELKSINENFFETMMGIEFNNTLNGWGERDEFFSDERLSSEWSKIMKKYFGPSVEFDEYVGGKWKNNTGSYYDFESYSRALSLATSKKVGEKILENDKESKINYRKFLGSGIEYDAETTIEKLGVNLTSDEYIKDMMTYYKQMLDELEKLIETN